MIVGFQSSAIIEVDEDVGIVEICLAVLNPSIDDPLDTSVILIIDALQGTAGMIMTTVNRVIFRTSLR